MNTLTRFFVCAIVASGLLAGAASISPEWFASANLDFWSLPELHASISQAQLRRAELAAEGQRVGERLELKQEAITALLDGRLSLFEAATRFRAANQLHSESMDSLRRIVPGRSEEEKVCRQVINWAVAAATHQDSPTEGEKVSARLEAELAQHLAQNGRVILPQD